MTPDMADAHETARARDARGTDFHREWLHVMDTQRPHTPQESDTMTDHRAEAERIRDDERRVVKPSGTRMDGAIVHALFAIHDTLTEIRDRMPERVEVKVAPFDPGVIAANLEAVKHELETPMRGHGECCEPADITEEPPVGPGVRMVTIRWDDARKLLNLARTAWRVGGRGEAHPTRLDQRTSAALDAAPVSESSLSITEAPGSDTEDAGTSSEPAPADVDPDEAIADAHVWHIQFTKEKAARDKAEADLARVTKERDEQTRDAIEWRNRYDALREDVSEKRWDNSVLGSDRAAYVTVVLRGILDRDEWAES